MDTQTQKYKAVIEIEYESEVFDDDPEDVYACAELEERHLVSSVRAIQDILDEAEILEVSVKPAI